MANCVSNSGAGAFIESSSPTAQQWHPVIIPASIPPEGAKVEAIAAGIDPFFFSRHAAFCRDCACCVESLH